METMCETGPEAVLPCCTAVTVATAGLFTLITDVYTIGSGLHSYIQT